MTRSIRGTLQVWYGATLVVAVVAVLVFWGQLQTLLVTHWHLPPLVPVCKLTPRLPNLVNMPKNLANAS